LLCWPSPLGGALPQRMRLTCVTSLVASQLLDTAAVFQPRGPSEMRDPEHYSDPLVWGPPTWFFLHSVALALPERVPVEQQMAMRQFLLTLQLTLPGPANQDEFSSWMRRHPVEHHLVSRARVVHWMMTAENACSKRYGLRTKPWSHNELMRAYNLAYSGASHERYLAVIGLREMSADASSPSAPDARPSNSTAAMLAPERYKNPMIWGPPAWFFLHSMTLALPEQVPDKQQASLWQLVLALQEVLPCPPCQQGLSTHAGMHRMEPHMATRSGMVRWMVDIHNMVNEALARPKWSLTDVVSAYTKAYSPGCAERYLAVIGNFTPRAKDSGTAFESRGSVGHHLRGAVWVSALAWIATMASTMQ